MLYNPTRFLAVLSVQKKFIQISDSYVLLLYQKSTLNLSLVWKDFNGLLNTEACIVLLVNLTYAVSFDFKLSKFGGNFFNLQIRNPG